MKMILLLFILRGEVTSSLDVNHASSVKDEPDLNNQTSRNQVFPVGKGEKARI